MSFTQSVLDGNRLAMARLLTWVENNTMDGRDALNELYPSTGRAHLIGVTGAPGTGKSSLVNQVALFMRRGIKDDNQSPAEFTPKVAIIAIDPSSPFTGGAILGDRIRMRDLSGDPGIFIRSMASRGSLGGLAKATASATQVLDAAGFDIILIETVGAGQAEVDIAKLAHTTVVIDSPGLGDDIQAIKAGILEIADILVVNKADIPGIEATERALRGMLQLGHPVTKDTQFHHGEKITTNNWGMSNSEVENSTSNIRTVEALEWIPPIQRTIATDGTGVPELIELIMLHREYLQNSDLWRVREQERVVSEVNMLLREALVSRWRESISEQQYSFVLNEVFDRKISPIQAVDSLTDDILN